MLSKQESFDAAKAARWKKASAEIDAQLAELKADTGQHGTPALLRHIQEQDEFNRLKNPHPLPQDRINEAAE